MADILIPFVIITLLAVIIVQAVERYWSASQTEAERQRLIAAVLAKNTSEYTALLKVDKEVTKPEQPSTEVELANATDEEFDKFIATQTK